MARLVLKNTELTQQEACTLIYYYYKNYLNKVEPIVVSSKVGVKYVKNIGLPIMENQEPEEWITEIFGLEDYQPTQNVTKEEWINWIIYPAIFYLDDLVYDIENMLARATELGFMDELGYEYVNEWYYPDQIISKRHAKKILSNTVNFLKEFLQ